MIAYIKLSTLEYPLHEGNIRNEHPEIREDQTWPNFPCPPDYALVNWVEPPVIAPPLQYVTMGKPQLIDGQWYVTWDVCQLTLEEWDAIVEERKKREPPAQPLRDPQKLLNSGTAPDVIA